MTEPLFVILGAGASCACTSAEAYVSRPERRPPLVTELFDTRFDDILREYPLAQMAAADIRQAQAAEDPPTLEEFIATRYRQSDHRDDRRKWLALPYYLQHALYEVSVGYTHQPDNLDLLLDRLRRLESVVIVTLNYDTLLEDRLRHIRGRPYVELADYLGFDIGIAVIKLHGSVNWAFPIRTAVDQDVFSSPPDELEVVHEEFVVMPGDQGVAALRFRSTPPPHYFFPALSVPIGSDDLLSCPDSHAEFLRNRLAAAEALDLLVIGYSAYDQEVVKLFSESEKPVRSIYVVNQSRAAASEVALRLAGQLGFEAKSDEHAFDGDFNAFVQSGEAGKYVEGLST